MPPDLENFLETEHNNTMGMDSMYEEEEEDWVKDALRRAREQAYQDAVSSFQEEERLAAITALKQTETRLVTAEAYAAATDLRKRKTVPVVEIWVPRGLFIKSEKSKPTTITVRPAPSSKSRVIKRRRASSGKAAKSKHGAKAKQKMGKPKSHIGAKQKQKMAKSNTKH